MCKGRESEKCELSFSYGKCFPYKSFFLTSPLGLLLECSIFKKEKKEKKKGGCFSMSVPSVLKWKRQD